MEHRDFKTEADRRAALLPFGRAAAASALFAGLENGAAAQDGACVLIPRETPGSYPLDLTADASAFRKDITGGLTGTPLDLTLTVVNLNHGCKPVANARVDAWHYDQDGAPFFRGIQLTDSDGRAAFTTLYPEWRAGAARRIHFQVFLNSVLSAISQLAFPGDPDANAPAGTACPIAILAANEKGGYDASLTVGLQPAETGLVRMEPETGGQFKLEGNYPNPFGLATVIPFSLAHASRVRINLFDTQGRKVLELLDERLEPGDQKVVLSRRNGGIFLSRGSYAYQLTVENASGVFRQCKLLTAD